MNINNAFPSKWLKSGDLGDEDVTLTIRAVEIEGVGGGDATETKPVLYFEETDKGMVLNKTNANTIAGMYTAETDNWIGKKITLFATEVDYAGKQTLAIRVRMRKPVAALRPAGKLVPSAGTAAHPPAPSGNGEGSLFDPAQLPKTVKEFEQWVAGQGLTGQDVHAALGTGLADWLKVNAGRSVEDAAKEMRAVLTQ